MRVLEQEVDGAPLWTAKSETASRLRGRIEAVLDWAKVHGYREGENPARWKGHLDNLLPARGKVRKVEHHAALPHREMPGKPPPSASRPPLLIPIDCRPIPSTYRVPFRFRRGQFICGPGQLDARPMREMGQLVFDKSPSALIPDLVRSTQFIRCGRNLNPCSDFQGFIPQVIE
jgi:hypothetical protein